ncbi:MAG: hypothetical protein M0Q92_02130 [Methanoregula sp.]|nr:hypothetical protein [Methanoregula sp.]
MIRTHKAVCVKCSHTFTIHEETGNKAHLLHCVRCGRDKRLGIPELKEYYHRYMANLINPAFDDTKKRDISIHPLFRHELLDIRRYVLMVEHIAGSCICGAVFRFSGKPRCPRCRSTVFHTLNRKDAAQVMANHSNMA